MDVMSFTKLNMTPQELQDTMKQMLMLENDPKSVTTSIVANALEQVNVNTDKVSHMISNDNLTSFQEEVSQYLNIDSVKVLYTTAFKHVRCHCWFLGLLKQPCREGR